jgi:hypothetical protein
MTDEALDRELERALAVDASPEFAARVRMRVADETMTLPWWSFRWRYVSTAAVVCAAVVLVVVVGSRPQRRVVHPATMQRAYNAPSLLPAASVPKAIAPATKPSAKGGRRTRALTRSNRDESPEVIVEPGQEQAIQMFAAAVWAQQVTPPPLPEEQQPLKIAPVDIVPIEIESLPEMAALEGERP